MFRKTLKPQADKLSYSTQQQIFFSVQMFYDYVPYIHVIRVLKRDDQYLQCDQYGYLVEMLSHLIIFYATNVLDSFTVPITLDI